jgi:cytochrome P450
MPFLVNLLRLPVRWLGFLGGGIASLAALLGLLAGAAKGPAAGRRGRLLGVLGTTAGQRALFGVLRVFWANLVIGRRLVTAYDNTGTVLVSRDADVREVLEREADFAVVYEPRMRAITSGQNFFLGMQDSPAYQHDVSVMRLAARWEDVDAIILPCVDERAAAVMAGADETLDVPARLTLPVVADMVARYFGTPVGGEGEPTRDDLIRWTSTLFWYLFIDLGADPDVDRRALESAAGARNWLDRCIAARKAAPTAAADVLNRCLDLQGAGTLGFDDLAIRNNLIGLIIGAVPTISRAAVQALDQLLDRPDILAEACAAARAGDDDKLAAIVFEALRFNPINPFIYRRAVTDTVIARGTLRARRIPKDSLVLASNLSAMFDAARLNDPGRFDATRPWDDYMLWGYGLHTCFGRHINRAVVPRLLKHLLAAGRPRRVQGAAGRIDTAGTPFPAHLSVELARS